MRQYIGFLFILIFLTLLVGCQTYTSLESKIFVIGLLIDFHILFIYFCIKVINKIISIEKNSDKIDENRIDKCVSIVTDSEISSKFAPGYRPLTKDFNEMKVELKNNFTLPDLKVETSYGDKKLGNAKIVKE